MRCCGISYSISVDRHFITISLKIIFLVINVSSGPESPPVEKNAKNHFGTDICRASWHRNWINDIIIVPMTIIKGCYFYLTQNWHNYRNANFLKIIYENLSLKNISLYHFPILSLITIYSYQKYFDY